MRVSFRTVSSWLLIGCVSGFAVLPALGDDADSEEVQPIEPEAVELGRAVDFKRDVAPILQKKCVACHNKSLAESGLNLESAETLLKGGDRGPSVVPKKPNESVLFQAASRTGDPLMPPVPNDVEAQPLTPRELGLLREWIVEGASRGAETASTSIQWQPLPPELNAIYAVALSPWGTRAACGRANQVTVYDLLAGEESAKLIDPNLTSMSQEGGNPMYAAGAAHRDFVHALAFNHDGNMLASGGYRVVKLWKRPQNIQKRRITAAEPLTAAVISPGGNAVAVAMVDHSIVLLKREDGSTLATLTGHTGTVTSLAYTPDGGRLVSASIDQSIRVWNVADGSLVGQIQAPAAINAMTLNKDGSQVVAAGGDHVIRLWPLPAGPSEESPATIRELAGHEKPVNALALVLPEGTQLISGSEDGTVRVWKLDDGTQQSSMNHAAPVTAVASRADGTAIASAGVNGISRIWQLGDGKQTAEITGTLATERSVQIRTEDEAVAKQQVGLAAAGVKEAVKNVTDREESLKKAQEAKTAADKAVEEAVQKEKAAADALTAAKTEFDNKMDDKELEKKAAEAEKAATAATAAVKSAKDKQASAVRGVSVAEKGLATMKERHAEAKSHHEAAETAAKQSTSALDEARKAAEAARQPIRSIAFSPDGQRLVTGGDGQTVHVADAATGKLLGSYIGHEGAVKAILFAAEGGLLSASVDRSLIEWETRPPWQLAAQLGTSADAPLDVSGSPFVGRVLALDFSRDGKLLVTGGGDPSRSGEITVWDVETASLVRKFDEPHSDTVQSVEFSRDGKRVLSGGADKFVKIFETETGEHVRSFEGHTHHVLGVSWKADAATITSAGADNAIKVWNVETGEQRRTISDYGKQVTAVQFVGIGDDIVSSSGDKNVRLHRTTNGQKLRDFGGGTDFMYSAAATREASIVVAGGEDGVLRVWNGKDGKSIKTFDPPKPPETDDKQASVSSAGTK